MHTRNVVAVLVVLAAVVVAVVAFGRLRITPRDAAGWWRQTVDGAHLPREIQISVPPLSGDDDTAIEVAIGDGAGNVRTVRGDIRFPRRVCVRDGTKTRCGSMDLQGRNITWARGEVWIREGMFDCANCVR
jgi:hypothetical protein